jgi:hypothetical protein
MAEALNFRYIDVPGRTRKPTKYFTVTGDTKLLSAAREKTASEVQRITFSNIFRRLGSPSEEAEMWVFNHNWFGKEHSHERQLRDGRRATTRFLKHLVEGQPVQETSAAVSLKAFRHVDGEYDIAAYVPLPNLENSLLAHNVVSRVAPIAKQVGLFKKINNPAFFEEKLREGVRINGSFSMNLGGTACIRTLGEIDPAQEVQPFRADNVTTEAQAITSLLALTAIASAARSSKL